MTTDACERAAQHNLGHVKQSDVLLLQVRTAYFGTRPII
jgi:hypothetical protein